MVGLVYALQYIITTVVLLSKLRVPGTRTQLRRSTQIFSTGRVPVQVVTRPRFYNIKHVNPHSSKMIIPCLSEVSSSQQEKSSRRESCLLLKLQNNSPEAVRVKQVKPRVVSDLTRYAILLVFAVSGASTPGTIFGAVTEMDKIHRSRPVVLYRGPMRDETARALQQTAEFFATQCARKEKSMETQFMARGVNSTSVGCESLRVVYRDSFAEEPAFADAIERKVRLVDSGGTPLINVQPEDVGLGMAIDVVGLLEAANSGQTWGCVVNDGGGTACSSLDTSATVTFWWRDMFNARELEEPGLEEFRVPQETTGGRRLTSRTAWHSLEKTSFNDYESDLIMLYPTQAGTGMTREGGCSLMSTNWLKMPFEFPSNKCSFSTYWERSGAGTPKAEVIFKNNYNGMGYDSRARLQRNHIEWMAVYGTVQMWYLTSVLLVQSAGTNQWSVKINYFTD